MRNKKIKFKDWLIVAVILVPWAVFWNKINAVMTNTTYKVIVNIVMYLSMLLLCLCFLGYMVRSRKQEQKKFELSNRS